MPSFARSIEGETYQRPPRFLPTPSLRRHQARRVSFAIPNLLAAVPTSIQSSLSFGVAAAPSWPFGRESGGDRRWQIPHRRLPLLPTQRWRRAADRGLGGS